MKVIESPVNTPKKTNPLKKNIFFRNPLLSALIALLCFLTLCIMGRVYPFGTETVLMSDLEAQYAPFLFLYKQLLTGSSSIKEMFYSFSLGGGKNMMSTFGYYLSSPLNFLVLFFKNYKVSSFIVLLMGIRIVLSSFTMSLYITDRQEDKTSYIGVLLGVFYAFSSYSLCYMFQLMWMDVFALFPLLLYFVEKYIKSGKKAGIIFTLLYIFLSNYYISYMAGIFSFFYLLVRLYMEGEFETPKKAIEKIGKFILMAVLSGLSLCVILIPVGLDTLTNADPTNSDISTRHISFAMINFIDQIFGGTNGEFGDIMIANYPFIFISTFVIVAIAIFFSSKVFDKKLRILYGVILALVYLSLSVVFLDEAWQVFDSPNWFWHRESFVFYPFFLIITLRVYEKRKEISKADIFKGTGIVIALLFVAQSFGSMKKNDGVFLAKLVFILVIAVFLLLFKKERWHEQLKNMPTILPFLFSLILVFECALFETMLSSGISTLSTHYGSNNDYASYILAADELSEGILNTPQSLRAEHEYTEAEWNGGRHLDAYYTGVNGISLFNSNSNKYYHHFLKQLGYKTNYNYFSLNYTFIAEDTDAFLSIGSVVTSRDYSNARYIWEDTYDCGFKLYRNEEVLPVAFSCSSSALDFDFYQLERDQGTKNYLMFRNMWYKSMFPDVFEEDFYYSPSEEFEMEVINGASIDLKDYITPESTEEETSELYSSSKIDYDTIGQETYDDVSYENTIYRVNSELPILISYKIRIESEDELYLNVSSVNRASSYDVYLNGEKLNSIIGGSYFSDVTRIGSFGAGDEINVTIASDADKFSYQSINFAYINHEVFSSQFADISNNTEITEFSNGHVVINSNLMDGEIVLTTIPYEAGWELTIDGKKADIVPYQQALIAINPGTGSHVIELNFTPPGMKVGAIASVVGILGLIAFSLIDKKNFTGAKAK